MDELYKVGNVLVDFALEVLDFAAAILQNKRSTWQARDGLE